MNALKWLGTSVLLVSGAFTAFNVFPANLMVGIVGCTILGSVALILKEWQYALINVTFFTLNVIGLASHFFY
jgi:hypothetical protein